METKRRWKRLLAWIGGVIGALAGLTVDGPVAFPRWLGWLDGWSQAAREHLVSTVGIPRWAVYAFAVLVFSGYLIVARIWLRSKAVHQSSSANPDAELTGLPFDSDSTEDLSDKRLQPVVAAWDPDTNPGSLLRIRINKNTNDTLEPLSSLVVSLNGMKNTSGMTKVVFLVGPSVCLSNRVLIDEPELSPDPNHNRYDLVRHSNSGFCLNTYDSGYPKIRVPATRRGIWRVELKAIVFTDTGEHEYKSHLWFQFSQSAPHLKPVEDPSTPIIAVELVAEDARRIRVVNTQSRLKHR